MTTAAEKIQAKMQAKISTRSLDQMTTELTMISKRGFSEETSILTHAYITNLERRFPEIAEAVWTYLDSEEVFLSFADALLVVRDNLSKTEA